MNQLSNEVSLALIAAVSSLLAAVLATVNVLVMRSMKVDIKDLEKNTNSMKDQLVKVVGESQRAEGKLEGKAEEKVAGGDQRAQGRIEGIAEGRVNQEIKIKIE